MLSLVLEPVIALVSFPLANESVPFLLPLPSGKCTFVISWGGKSSEHITITKAATKGLSKWSLPVILLAITLKKDVYPWENITYK